MWWSKWRNTNLHSEDLRLVVITSIQSLRESSNLIGWSLECQAFWLAGRQNVNHFVWLAFWVLSMLLGCSWLQPSIKPITTREPIKCQAFWLAAGEVSSPFNQSELMNFGFAVLIHWILMDDRQLFCRTNPCCKGAVSTFHIYYYMERSRKCELWTTNVRNGKECKHMPG